MSRDPLRGARRRPLRDVVRVRHPTVEPASRNGMSAAAQAGRLRAHGSPRPAPKRTSTTALGAGDVWTGRATPGNASDIRASQTSGRRDTSPSRGATRLLKRYTASDWMRQPTTRSVRHREPDGTDHDKSAFVNGSLSRPPHVAEALGGARPHRRRRDKMRRVHEDAHAPAGRGVCPGHVAVRRGGYVAGHARHGHVRSSTRSRKPRI